MLILAISINISLANDYVGGCMLSAYMLMELERILSFVCTVQKFIFPFSRQWCMFQ